MGKSFTPKYRIEVDGQKMAWRGPVNKTRLSQWIQAYAKSHEIGGVNEHISHALGYVPYPSHAVIIRQRDNAVIAEWRAAAFQVY